MALSGLHNSDGTLGTAALSSPGERGAHREGDQHPDPSLPSLRVIRSCSQAPSAGEAGLINVSPENTTLALSQGLFLPSPALQLLAPLQAEEEKGLETVHSDDAIRSLCSSDTQGSALFSPLSGYITVVV